MDIPGSPGRQGVSHTHTHTHTHTHARAHTHTHTHIFQKIVQRVLRPLYVVYEAFFTWQIVHVIFMSMSACRLFAGEALLQGIRKHENRSHGVWEIGTLEGGLVKIDRSIICYIMSHVISGCLHMNLDGDGEIQIDPWLHLIHFHSATMATRHGKISMILAENPLIQPLSLIRLAYRYTILNPHLYNLRLT